MDSTTNLTLGRTAYLTLQRYANELANPDLSASDRAQIESELQGAEKLYAGIYHVDVRTIENIFNQIPTSASMGGFDDLYNAFSATISQAQNDAKTLYNDGTLEGDVTNIQTDLTSFQSDFQRIQTDIANGTPIQDNFLNDIESLVSRVEALSNDYSKEGWPSNYSALPTDIAESFSLLYAMQNDLQTESTVQSVSSQINTATSPQQLATLNSQLSARLNYVNQSTPMIESGITAIQPQLSGDAASTATSIINTINLNAGVQVSDIQKVMKDLSSTKKRPSPRDLLAAVNTLQISRGAVMGADAMAQKVNSDMETKINQNFYGTSAPVLPTGLPTNTTSDLFNPDPHTTYSIQYIQAMLEAIAKAQQNDSGNAATYQGYITAWSTIQSTMNQLMNQQTNPINGVSQNQVTNLQNDQSALSGSSSLGNAIAQFDGITANNVVAVGVS